eukprot:m.164035 g.164035  ORF g.164035 m.164035 type:complete len:373 (-) comp17125_c0_seq1:1850-2968(-)
MWGGDEEGVGQEEECEVVSKRKMSISCINSCANTHTDNPYLPSLVHTSKTPTYTTTLSHPPTSLQPHHHTCSPHLEEEGVQLGHLVLGSAPPPSASAPAAPSAASSAAPATEHRVAADRVLEDNELVEDAVAEDASAVLGEAAGERRVVLVEVDIEECGAALLADLTAGAHLVGVLEEADDDVAGVAEHLPLGSAVWVEDEHALLALDAGADTVLRQSVLAGRVGALAAGRVLAHAVKGREVVAVRAQRVGLAARAGREEHNLKAVQRALEIHVGADLAVLRHRVRLLAVRAVQAAGLGRNILHEAQALAAARQRLARRSERREGHLKELVHLRNLARKVNELPEKHVQRILQHLPVVRLALGNEVELLFHL